MKSQIQRFILVTALTLFSVCAVQAADTSTQGSIVNPEWNGKKIPVGQQCNKFGGDNPMSPQIKITGLPLETQAVLLRFNDESFQKMKQGGHGVIGMRVEPGTTELLFPAIPGHSFKLPDNVFMVRAHKAPTWDKAGAYLPPCSGGKGHRYSVTIQPSTIKNWDKKKFKKIESVKVNIGRY